MNMFRVLFLVVSSLAWGVSVQAAPQKLWELSGFDKPESALISPDGSFAYVSNIVGSPFEKDGEGFISKVSLGGKVLAMWWAEGLHAPKGMALVGAHLYVADIDQLVKIDTATGKIVKRYPAAGAKFLNDVAAGSDGTVYVSDTGTNTIWRLAGDTFEVLVKDDALKGPNGLYVDGSRGLLIASFGALAQDDKPAVSAGLVYFKFETKTILPFGDGKAIGNMDGLERYSQTTFLVSDWGNGGVYKVDANTGGAKRILSLDKGSADIDYASETLTLLVPMMLGGKLLAYKLD